eukprot:2057455-Alexandrium_andersonii.AAC.1
MDALEHARKGASCNCGAPGHACAPQSPGTGRPCVIMNRRQLGLQGKAHGCGVYACSPGASGM